jgi:NitT/TauT family transport system permease protein
MRNLEKCIDIMLLLLGIAFAWQIMHWLTGASVLPSPLETSSRLGELLQEGWFRADIYETLQAIAAASVIVVVFGCAFGVLFALYRTWGEVSEPILITFYSIPKVVFYPIVLLICGLTISARIVFGVIHGIVPVILFVMGAVIAVRPVLIRSARVMNLSRYQLVANIVLPAAWPGIVTGLRVGYSATILGVLVGEMFASKKGLGYRLINAVTSHDVTTIMAVAMLLSLFALATNYAFLLTLANRVPTRAE